MWKEEDGLRAIRGSGNLRQESSLPLSQAFPGCLQRPQHTPTKHPLKLLIGPVGTVPKSIGTLRASTGACAELWLAVRYLLPDGMEALMRKLTVLSRDPTDRPGPS